MRKAYNTIESISKSISSGITPLRSNTTYWSDGVIPWLKTEQLGEFQIEDTDEKISKKALEETGIKINPANTISIALYGEGKTRGNVSILKNPMTTNQACCNIVVDEQFADYRYVYYWLKNNYHQIRNLSSGVRKNLSADEIKTFPFNYREQNEQSIIADFLSTLDSKIQLNNRINTELEAMAKTIYNYWFVQFDFPNAEGNPYKTSGGEMEWKEELKREIPKGWEIKSLSEIENNIVTGKTPSTENDEYYNGEIPFITIPAIRGNIFIINTEKRLTKLGANTQQNKFLPVDSICVSCIASPGLVGFVTEPSQTNQQINSVVCHDEVNKFYLYFAIKEYFENSFGAKIGNTFVNMNKEEFSEIKLVYPKHSVLQEYHALISDKFELVKNKSFENQELIHLRDFLLPLLMNGQVKVK